MSLQRLKSLTSFQQRKAAAILGALVADAAVVPLHWIYDRDNVSAQDKIAGLIEAEGTAEFYPTSQCPFYTIPVGENSGYADQLYVTLKNIAQNKGFNAKSLEEALFKHFGPDTVYESARTQSGMPLKGPWTHICIKIMLANRENGVDPPTDKKSKDPDGFSKAIALAGLLGSEEGALLDQVRECVQTLQLNPVAIDYAVAGFQLLEHTIRTGEVDFSAMKNPTQMDSLKEGISKVMQFTGTHNEAIKWNPGCGYPGSFDVALHGLKCAKDYVSGVRAEIRAGGDNCSRVILIGAITAAQGGLDSIPEEWLKKYNKAEEVIGYIETVVQL